MLRITLYKLTLPRILHRLSSLPGNTFVVLLLSAGTVAADGLALKKDVELIGSAAVGKDAPLFVNADKIESTAPHVIEASGQVQRAQTIYDLSITSCFQLRSGSGASDIKEVINWARRIEAPSLSSSGALHGYSGDLPSCSVSSLADEFGGSWFVPLSVRLHPGETISKWQWWRDCRGVWGPAPYLHSNEINVSCDDDEITFRVANEVVARWIDWVDGLQECLPRGVEPATGQLLLVHRNLVEQFATETNLNFCWLMQVSGYSRERGYGEYSRFTAEQALGMSSILLPG